MEPVRRICIIRALRVKDQMYHYETGYPAYHKFPSSLVVRAFDQSAKA